MTDAVHLTTQQAAAYLGISRRKLLALAHSGQLPCAWLGPKSPRFPRFSLDAWMEREALRKHSHLRVVGAGE